jgi:hypothetical protein
MIRRSPARAPPRFRRFPGDFTPLFGGQRLRPGWTSSFAAPPGQLGPVLGGQFGHPGFAAPFADLGQVFSDGRCGGFYLVRHSELGQFLMIPSTSGS